MKQPFIKIGGVTEYVPLLTQPVSVLFCFHQVFPIFQCDLNERDMKA